MKRILIILTAAAFVALLTRSAFSVDKKEKKESPKTEAKADSAAQKKEATNSDLRKKYDDFIDLNKNGKDDRYENRKPKSPKTIPAKLTQDKPAKKKPVSIVPKKDEKKADSSAKKPNWTTA